MNAVIRYTIADSPALLYQILSLQSRNHYSALSDDEKSQYGFLSVRYTFDQLVRMSEREPQIVALHGDNVIGYALTTTASLRGEIDSLEPLINETEVLAQKGVSILREPYIICGQVCIDKDFRGRNVFAGLYMMMKEMLSDRYIQCVAEIAVNNQRSFRAHEKLGFRSEHIYADAGQDWHIAVWNWKQE